MNILKAARAGCALALIAAATTIAAQEQGVILSMGLKEDAGMTYALTDAETAFPNPGWFSISTVSIGAVNRDRDFLKVEAQLETGIAQGLARDISLARLLPVLPPGLQAMVSSWDAFPLLSLRKLYAQADMGFATFKIGRQIINRGRGTFFSPADLFSETDISGLTPRRTGSDSVGIDVPLGATAGFEVMGRPESDAGRGLYETRVYGGTGGFEGSAFFARDGSGGKAWKTGADLQFDLGLTFRAEGLFTIADDFKSADFRGMAGFDYSIGTEWFFLAEYAYRTDPSDPAAPETAFDPFPARQYAAALIRYDTGEYVSVQALGLANIDDMTAAATVSLSWAAAKNATISPYIRYTRGSLSGAETDDTISGGIIVTGKF